MLRNKDNLHLISLGCSAGNNGRYSCVALNPSTAGAEWPPLFGAGAAGALQSGLDLCVTDCGHGQEVQTERNWVLGKPTPSLLLPRGGVQQPWDAEEKRKKRKKHHPPVGALWG